MTTFVAVYCPSDYEGESPTKEGFESRESAWEWVKNNHLCSRCLGSSDPPENTNCGAAWVVVTAEEWDAAEHSPLSAMFNNSETTAWEPEQSRPWQYDIFLISPVRQQTPELEAIARKYVEEQEARGLRVYWPYRDTDQENDPIGLRICQDNRRAMQASKEVHLFWCPDSQGSVFDMGMAFAMHKPIFLTNWEDIEKTPAKSFGNVFLELDAWSKAWSKVDPEILEEMRGYMEEDTER